MDILQRLNSLTEKGEEHVGLEGLGKVDDWIEAVVLCKVDHHEIVGEVDAVVVAGLVVLLVVKVLEWMDLNSSWEVTHFKKQLEFIL